MMEILKIPAQMKYLDDILNMTETHLETFDCSEKTLYQIQVSIEEVFTNIVSYAYDNEDGLVEVQCHVTSSTVDTEDQKTESTIWITLSDKGKPYNPLEKPDPDFSIPFEDRGIGGLGIYMVKKFMDYMDYRYVNGCNQFTIGKKL